MSYLYHQDRLASYAYFLISGSASLLSSTGESLKAEVGMIGNEGMVGALDVLGPGVSPTSCLMQAEGAAWQIELAELRTFFDRIPELQSRILEYAQCECYNTTTIAGCNRLHGTEARLARWLLTARDALRTEELPLTHDVLALFIGANRATVSLALEHYGEEGLVRVGRGRLFLLKPHLLRSRACECLPTIQARIRSLYSQKI